MKYNNIHRVAVAFLSVPVAVLSVLKPVSRFLSKFATLWYSLSRRMEFGSCPRNVVIHPKLELIGGKCISIGNNVRIGSDVVLSAHRYFAGQKFSPTITIGDGVRLGKRIHITAIDRISVGCGTRLGDDILITDNSHGGGKGLADQLSMSPILRPLYSKGPVVIGENVWIGSNSAILAGVTIGEGAIIGTGAVITHDVPPYGVAVGNPARVVKIMKE